MKLKIVVSKVLPNIMFQEKIRLNLGMFGREQINSYESVVSLI